MLDALQNLTSSREFQPAADDNLAPLTHAMAIPEDSEQRLAAAITHLEQRLIYLEDHMENSPAKDPNDPSQLAQPTQHQDESRTFLPGDFV